MDWLDEVLDATSEAESPTSFMYWSALCAVSAVINNQVWLPKGGLYELFPNIYVLLIAKSGMRKGYPVAVSKNLVQEVNNTRLISGRISFQALIKELATARSLPGGKIIKDSIGFINSGEFSTSLVRDPEALTTLTDLYDGHYNKKWVNTLKGTGKEELRNVCITLLGALNQTHFNDLITAKEISGGFIARCILVLEEKRSRKNALLRPGSKKVDIPELAKYLHQLKEVRGPVTMDEDAIVYFEKWYDDFDPEGMDDRTGTANRIHDNILKVAMLITLARTGERRITLAHIEEAMGVTLSSAQSVDKVTVGRGVDEDYSKKLVIFIRELFTAPEYTIDKQKVLSKNYGHFDKWDLDRMVEHLVTSGGLEVFPEGGKIYYRLTAKSIQDLGGRFGRKDAKAS